MPSKKSYSRSSSSSESDSSDSEWTCKKRKRCKKCKKIKCTIKCSTNWSFEPAYISLYGKKSQTLNANDPVVFEFVQIEKNFCFVPNTSKITVSQDGVYVFNAIIIPNEPSQFTLFINNLPYSFTTTGTNGAGTNMLMSQILELKCGDVLELLNFTSAVNGGTVTIPSSIGGIIPGSSNNVELSIFKIDSLKCEYPQHKVYTKKR